MNVHFTGGIKVDFAKYIISHGSKVEPMILFFPFAPLLCPPLTPFFPVN
jgi:hypothetical protein